MLWLIVFSEKVGIFAQGGKRCSDMSDHVCRTFCESILLTERLFFLLLTEIGKCFFYTSLNISYIKESFMFRRLTASGRWSSVRHESLVEKLISRCPGFSFQCSCAALLGTANRVVHIIMMSEADEFMNGAFLTDKLRLKWNECRHL